MRRGRKRGAGPFEQQPGQGLPGQYGLRPTALRVVAVQQVGQGGAADIRPAAWPQARSGGRCQRRELLQETGFHVGGQPFAGLHPCLEGALRVGQQGVALPAPEQGLPGRGEPVGFVQGAAQAAGLLGAGVQDWRAGRVGQGVQFAHLPRDRGSGVLVDVKGLVDQGGSQRPGVRFSQAGQQHARRPLAVSQGQRRVGVQVRPAARPAPAVRVRGPVRAGQRVGWRAGQLVQPGVRAVEGQERRALRAESGPQVRGLRDQCQSGGQGGRRLHGLQRAMPAGGGEWQTGSRSRPGRGVLNNRTTAVGCLRGPADPGAGACCFGGTHDTFTFGLYQAWRLRGETKNAGTAGKA